MIRVSGTCPDSKLRDAGRAVKLAQRAVELTPKAAHVWNTLGVAQYRAQNWEQSIESLMKSEALESGKRLGFNGFFLAMAEWQRGHKDEARPWYDQSVEWMEKNRPQDEDLKRFRAEAAELLKIDQPITTQPK